jgi:hypothetical protein
MRWEIRKAVNIKNWEEYSSRWKKGTGKETNHNGRHCGGFRIVGPTDEALRERRFSSDEEVLSAVQKWLKTQRPASFFPDGIRKLVKRWNRWVEVGGGGVWITLKSNITFVSVYLQ